MLHTCVYDMAFKEHCQLVSQGSFSRWGNQGLENSPELKSNPLPGRDWSPIPAVLSCLLSGTEQRGAEGRGSTSHRLLRHPCACYSFPGLLLKNGSVQKKLEEEQVREPYACTPQGNLVDVALKAVTWVQGTAATYPTPSP